MSDKFLKSLIYTILSIIFIIFLFVQPYNIYCKASKKCFPITFSDFSIKKKGKKAITVNFKAGISSEFKDIVEFYPKKPSIKIYNNEEIKNFYIAKNLSNKEITIRTRYSVKPEMANKFLNRIECLCFKSNIIKANEQINMPLRFGIKSEINNKTVKEINISYTIDISSGLKP